MQAPLNVKVRPNFQIL